MNSVLRALIFIFILSFIIRPCQGQDYVTEHFSVQHLLPTNEVYKCIADSRGYIWMGTEAGLLRYDGKDLDKIDFLDGPSYQSVYEIHEDNLGRLWFFASDGKIRFLQDGEQHVIDDDISSFSSFKMGFCQSSDSTIWTGSIREGYFSYKQGGQLKHYQPTIGVISDIVSISEQELAIIGSRGIFRHDIGTGQSTLVIDYQTHNIVRSVVREDTLYVFSAEDISKVKLSTLVEISRKSITFSLEHIIHVSLDADNRILIGTRNSLYIYNNDEIKEHEFADELRDHSISYYFEDQSSNIWVSTLDAGIFRFYRPNISKVKQIDLNPIKHITGDMHMLLLGSNKGRFQQVAGNVIFTKDRIEGWLFEGNVIAKYDDGPYKWSVTDHTISLNFEGQEYQTKFSSRGVTYDYNTHALNIANGAGAFRFTPEQFISLTHIGYPAFILSTDLSPTKKYSSDIKDLAQTPDGQQWYTGKKGLANQSKDFDYWSKRHELLDQEFEKIVSDQKDIIYMSTRYDEILCYNIVMDSVYQLIAKTDHCGEIIRDLSYDNRRHKLWVTYNTGISSIDIMDPQKKVMCYSFSDGLPYASINATYPTDTSLLIGTEDGLYRLLIEDEINPDQIRIDIIGVAEGTQENQIYRISSAQNSLLFDALAIGCGQGLYYKYKIDNDQDWSITEDERLPLDRLSYGLNEIIIQAESLSGKRSAETVISIYYKKPWYKKQVTILVFALILLALFYSGIVSLNMEIIKNRLAQWLSRIQTPPQTLTIKTTDGSFIKVLVDHILYIRAAGNYIEIYTSQRKYVSRMTFSAFIKELSSVKALRQIHRSYIVNMSKIEEVDLKTVLIDQYKIPYSPKYKDVIRPLKSRIELSTNRVI